MRKRMMEEAEKHLNGSMKSVLILSVVTVCTGLLLDVERVGGVESCRMDLDCRKQYPVHFRRLVSSAWRLGRSFFQKTASSYSGLRGDPVAFIRCTGGGMVSGSGCDGLYGCRLPFHTGWEEDRVLFVMFAILFSCAAFFLFYGYRKCYILLCDSRIEYRGFFRKKTVPVSDIKKILVIEKRNRNGLMVKVGYRFLGADEKELFTAGIDMVHVQEFMNHFSDLYQQAATEYVAGKQQEEREQN